MPSTPGVYIEEVNTLPPSVAPVATAVPAFIGYTLLGKERGPEVVRIESLLDYERRFGRTLSTEFVVKVKDGEGPDVVSNSGDPIEPAPPKYLLWYALSLYFGNGGGPCYVVSIGNQNTVENTGPAVADFESGINALKAFDEPTLIVLPDAISLKEAENAGVYAKTLAHCAELKDRFAILDAPNSVPTVTNDEVEGRIVRKVEWKSGLPTKDTPVEFRNLLDPHNLCYGALYFPYLETTLRHVVDDASVTLNGAVPKVGVEGGSMKDATFAELSSVDTSLYNAIRRLIQQQRVILPPSAAIAGVYARTDRERGVWKAPANVGLLGVVGPTLALTDEQQETLNIDPTGGKSINAIRSFTGRGPAIVWGARTLAGNDNEWRYVPVRRLFIMIEESAKKATAFAVFEPNDATTWLKVKGMIESFLYGLWERGALQGAKAEAAYFVNVGLNKTMTQQDVLEGRMIVEIGVAAVRPAEFITLRFSHKLAES